MTATEPLAWAVIIGSAAASVFIVLEKLKAIEYLQLNATRIFGRLKNLPNCKFCMLFWLCFLLSIPLFLISNIFYIALAFASAPIAKALYENCRATR